MKRNFVVTILAVAMMSSVGGAQAIPWLTWTLLPQEKMDEIIGEASGETAWKTIASVAAFNRDRGEEEFRDMFLETRIVTDLLNRYGLQGIEVLRYPGGKIWHADKGELWEVKPFRQKIASINDMVPMLAAWSLPTDATAELVWVGRGTPEEIRQANVRGKIAVAVTEGEAEVLCNDGYLGQGALGIIAISMIRPFFDPLQFPWSEMDVLGYPHLPPPSNRENMPKFGFVLPAREGDLLIKRLLAGEKITVHVEIEARELPNRYEDIVALIPGTDPNAGEVILTAHLFEGNVKQGANDNMSGSACILETARVLHTLINQGRLPRPKRAIRFLWGPEFFGMEEWIKANPALMKKTLCNINLDMVGEWLSRHQTFFCLVRTTYGRPHYINDIMENYYRFIGESSRERLQNKGVLRRIVAPFGADEPFPYSIEWYYGASDHAIFNNWCIGVPGVMMIAWPDRWYHTSGDPADKADPTQLKRAVVIAAAGAYTIASADDDMAVKIASETAANAARRIAIQTQAGIETLNRANAATFLESYKRAKFNLEAAVVNEKETLNSILELASNKEKVAKHISGMKETVDGIGASQSRLIQTHMMAVSDRLGVSAVRKIELTDLEKKAASMYPETTENIRVEGISEYQKVIDELPQDVKDKYPFEAAGENESVVNTKELQRLINGKRSVLDIKRILDAQAPASTNLKAVLNYLEILKHAGLVKLN
jgi:hypothetical protein